MLPLLVLLTCLGDACCPSGTTCLPQSAGYHYNTSKARCNLEANLLPSSIYASSTPAATATSSTGTNLPQNSGGPSTGTSSDSSSSSISGGAIAGAVIGAVAGAILIALAVFLFLRRYRRSRNKSTASEQPLQRDEKVKEHFDSPNEAPMEMDGTVRPMEVDGASRYVEAPGTIPPKRDSKKQGPTERQELPG